MWLTKGSWWLDLPSPPPQNSVHFLLPFLIGGGQRTARMASSKTVFSPRCVSAEHSRYLTEPASQEQTVWTWDFAHTKNTYIQYNRMYIYKLIVCYNLLLYYIYAVTISIVNIHIWLNLSCYDVIKKKTFSQCHRFVGPGVFDGMLRDVGLQCGLIGPH